MSLLEVIIALLTIGRVFLILVLSHLELLLKRCVLVLDTGLCRLEENHDTLPLKYAKDQNTIGTKEIIGEG